METTQNSHAKKHLGNHNLTSSLGWVWDRIKFLPPATPSSVIDLSKPLIIYVGSLGIVAFAFAYFTVRLPHDYLTLGIVIASIFAMAMYSVEFVTSEGRTWSAAPLVYLGVSLVFGPAGALSGSLAEAAGNAIRYPGAGWFRSLFNIVNRYLDGMAALAAFHLITFNSPQSIGLVAIGSLCGGAAVLITNQILLGGVMKINDPSIRLIVFFRQSLYVAPFSIGYGWTAFGSATLYKHAGTLGFTATIVPVLFLQGFLVFLARRVHAHEQATLQHAREREALLQKAIDASDAERRRIARDLHDSVVQNLAGMAFTLSAAAKRFKVSESAHHTAIAKSNGTQSDALNGAIGGALDGGPSGTDHGVAMNRSDADSGVPANSSSSNVGSSDVSDRERALNSADKATKHHSVPTKPTTPAGPSNNNGDITNEITEIMTHAAQETRSAMRDLRTLIIEIAPPDLERTGLAAALKQLLDPLARTGVNTHIEAPPNPPLTPDNVALIFRVSQEALRNVAKHAHAKNVEVKLCDDGEHVILTIDDDGRGFSKADWDRRRDEGHVGITLLPTLAKDAGASLDIWSDLGKGTHFTLEVPRTGAAKS